MWNILVRIRLLSSNTHGNERFCLPDNSDVIELRRVEIFGNGASILHVSHFG